MTTSHLLSTESIIESAHIVAGASNMVGEELRSRVDAMAGFFRGNGPYSVDQTIATRRQLVKLLARRIGIAADVARHPEILEEEVNDPIFVVGFLRTGTSILQALLAADPANRAVRVWQTREPSPAPGERPVAPLRMIAAFDDLKGFVLRCQGLVALHPYWDEGAEALIEDEEIQSLDFHNSYPTMLYDAPSLGYMMTNEDHTGRYRFIKLFMQHQQWNLPKRRWVMKGVDHQSYLPSLFSVFPDARCVFPHREPAEFIPSGLAIASTLYDGVTGGALDRKTLGVAMFADLRSRLSRMADDPVLNDPRVTHMPFKTFIADPVGMLRHCYAGWGFDWSPKGEAAMGTWLSDPRNDSDRYGRHRYTFEPFGINWEKESPAFDEYRRRFLGKP